MRDRLDVQHAAQGAGGQHIHVGKENILARRRLDAQFGHGALQRVGVEVRRQHLRPLRAQQARQAIAHVAQALHRHPQAGEIAPARTMLERGPDRHENPLSRIRRRIPAVFRSADAGNVRRHRPHTAQILYRGSRILSGDIAPAERIDKTPHRAQQGGRFGRAGIADDHRFATALGQAGQSRFVGHHARQAQHVVERGVIAGIGVHATAADAGSERRIVHGDNRAQTAGAVRAENELLVIVEGDGVKHTHEKVLLLAC